MLLIRIRLCGVASVAAALWFTSIVLFGQRASVVHPFHDAAQDVAHIVQWLDELGIEVNVVRENELVRESVASSDLVIWNGGCCQNAGLRDSTVLILEEVFQAGVPLYFIGDDLAFSIVNLSPAVAPKWTQLIHLEGTANFGGDGTISIVNQEHPVTNGSFGVVSDFEYPLDPDVASATGTGEVLLAVSGTDDVIVAYEDPTTGTRSLTQNVMAFEHDVPFGEATMKELERLLKNGVAWLLQAETPATSRFVFPQFADGLFGSIQFQSTLILANSGPASIVEVELRSSPDGEPMEMELGALGTGWRFSFILNRGETVSLTTPGIGQLKAGYAQIVAGEGVGGLVVFSRTDANTNTLLYEAGVPATSALTEFVVVVDSLGARDTGLALVNLSPDGAMASDDGAASLSLQLYDRHFSLIAETVLEPFAPGGHAARFIHEFFDDPTVKDIAREMQGMLVVSSDNPIFAVTLRQNDGGIRAFPEAVPTLTTFPVIPGNPNLEQ
jgi:hypothetical protein